MSKATNATIMFVIIAIILGLIALNKDDGKPQSRTYAPIVPKLTKCEGLKKMYNKSLEQRYTAIKRGYHDKGFDEVVAWDAKKLMESPECIDETMDKGKIEMWAKPYYISY